MARLTRRLFLGSSLAAGASLASGSLLGCGPGTPPPYFPPTGLSRAFPGPVLHLRAVSVTPGRIDFIFFAAGQLRHKWLEVTSPGVHRWGPDETSPGEPLGVYEYPTVAAVRGKLVVVVVQTDGQALFRSLDLTTGWTSWIPVPGALLRQSSAVVFEDGEQLPRIIGMEPSRELRFTTIALSGATWYPQPWRSLAAPAQDLGQLEWTQIAVQPRWGGVPFGRTSTGALVYNWWNPTWSSIRDGQASPSDAVTGHYFGGSFRPILFTNVRSPSGTDSLRFLWADTSNGEHFVDYPYARPPLIVCQNPTASPDVDRLDLFTTVRQTPESGRTTLLWAQVTYSDLIEGRLPWQPLASDLSLGGEQLCAVSWGPGRLDVFATDVAGNVWHKWQDMRSTLGWQPST